ncbi:MAG TPA: M48 family metalloprotease [Blastocatellia bacterium]|nr:M48 family metalloprotease [Blastocatellia bacterium]
MPIASGGCASREEAMSGQIALTAILIISFPLTLTAQPSRDFAAMGKADDRREESLEGAEAAGAVARLGGLSSDAIRERLRQMRLPAYLPGPVFVNRIVELQRLPVADSKRVDQLKAALQPVFAYHGRSRMPIVVLRSDQPKAYLVERAVIIITTRMMVIASDEEIRGIVAHELAHEYVWDERIKAMNTKDVKLMRECELFCDAVAAFTLKEIGADPASYGRILERLTIIGINAGNAMRQESDTHPSLDARKKLNKFLCQRFD